MFLDFFGFLLVFLVGCGGENVPQPFCCFSIVGFGADSSDENPPESA